MTAMIPQTNVRSASAAIATSLATKRSLYNVTNLYAVHTVRLTDFPNTSQWEPVFFGDWLASHCPLLFVDIWKKCSGSGIIGFRPRDNVWDVGSLSDEVLAALVSVRGRLPSGIVELCPGNPPTSSDMVRSFKLIREAHESLARLLESSLAYKLEEGREED